VLEDPYLFVSITLAIGLAAGLVGGLAGIGGSIIILPALALFIGYSTPDKPEHHLYMAAAMVVNAIVAFASTRKHRQAGAIDPNLTRCLLPPMLGGIIAGILLSNVMQGNTLKLGLIGFLWLYCGYAVFTTIRRLPDPAPERSRSGWVWIGGIGALTGVLAGLLGIGGGIVMVPLMIIMARVPVRRAVAASAWAMQITAPIGAALKLATLHGHGQSWVHAVYFAIPMAIGAMIGSSVGAELTHRLRLPYLRLAIAVILAAASARLAGFF
jgi:uncharacterized membrane protein YfcA